MLLVGLCGSRPASRLGPVLTPLQDRRSVVTDVSVTDVELLVEHERGGAEHDVVVAEAGGPQRQLLADLWHGAGGDGVERRLAEGLGGDRLGAGQDHVADVERAEHGGERGAEPFAGAAQDLDLALAAGRAEPAAEQRRRDLGLETAALAARADRAVGIDDDVADLAGGRTRAAVEGAVEDEPDTDTLVDPDHQEVGRVGDAERELGQRRRVGVVGDVDAETRTGGQLVGDRDLAPAEAGGAQHGAVGIDDARGGDTDAEQRPVGVADEVVADRAEQRERVGTGAVVALVGAAQHDLAGEVDERTDELVGLGEADRHDVAGIGLDADHRRRLADRPARTAELVDQACLEQLLDHGRHGGRGESDELGEVGPRGGAAVMQGPQDQPPVGATGVLGQHPRLAGQAIPERSPIGGVAGVTSMCLFIYYMN